MRPRCIGSGRARSHISFHSITHVYHNTRFKKNVKSEMFTTPWCRVLLEKLTGLQLVKKFPAFHGTRRFITALTSVHHLSLSWASPIQSIYPHPTSWRSILILSTHLCLGLPSGLFPSGFPTKTLYATVKSKTKYTKQRQSSVYFLTDGRKTRRPECSYFLRFTPHDIKRNHTERCNIK